MKEKKTSISLLFVLVLVSFVLFACSTGTINTTGEEKQELVITTNPTKLTYNMNESISLSGIVVKIKYLDGTYSDEITSSSLTFEAPDMTTGGEKTVKIKYKKDSISYEGSYTITVLKMESSITLKSSYNPIYGSPTSEDYTIVGNGTVSCKWALTTDLDTLFETQPTNVGSYRIFVYTSETDSYYSSSTYKDYTLTKSAQLISDISELSKVSDGTPVSNPTFSKLGDGEATITYYKVNSSNERTQLASAPKLVGNYKVRIDISESTNYLSGYAEKDFSITLIIDNTYAKSSLLKASYTLDPLTTENVQKINDSLKIAYFHTSHGAQVIEGTNNISQYVLNNDTIYDNYSEGGANNYKDAGNSDVYLTTKTYIDSNTNTNVVIWAWCGQLCWMTTEHVNDYLDDMTQLENEYPNVTFVYMTGHAFNASYDLKGDGRTGTVEINTANNELIRDYCIENNKVLFDFEKMDMYDPDGNYFGNKNVKDDCTYDSNNDGTFEGNWAVEWANRQNITSEMKSFYGRTGSYHTTNLNSICKAFAFWNMLYLLCD